MPGSTKVLLPEAQRKCRKFREDQPVRDYERKLPPGPDCKKILEFNLASSS